MDNKPIDPLIHLVEQRFVQAVNAHGALTRSVGGDGRTAQPEQVTLTYAEGQMVELSRLRDIMQRLGQVSRPVALRVLEHDIRDWRSVYARHVDADQPCMLSLAYSNGALEAAEATLIAVRMADLPLEDGR